MRTYSKVLSRTEASETLACGHTVAWPAPQRARRGRNPCARYRRCYQCEWVRDQYEEQRVELCDIYAK